MPAPLDGVTILDFTRYQQGPFATVMLSDMGAEVIKVEEREHGDLGRALGLRPDGFCAYFEAHNRNKKSITLDVRTDEGRKLVHQLAERVDVVAENFRPGVMDRLGIGYDALSEINPRIIMASASGFGRKGSKAKRPSYDVIGQAMGGIMVAQGGAGRDPQMITGGFADHVGAMFLAFGVAMALIARDRYGVGQHVDASLLGGQIAFQPMAFLRHLQPAGPVGGYENPLFRAYECGDGSWLAIGILDPKVWPSLMRALGKPELAVDPRFAEPQVRFQHSAELRAELQAIFRSRPRREWMARMEEHDVPAGPVLSHVEVAADPDVIENEYIVEVEHPHIGTIRTPGVPVRLSKTPGTVRSAAPELGQHTE
ncbi:MAG: CaiB/BaiF CoA transferase family protein [Dehalococcoidia bacterium]